MFGLKSYLPILARHLNTSEAVLYERQRKLTRAGLLVGTVGRGPGSGIRVSAPGVTIMVLAMMASDDLAEVEARADFLAASTSDQHRCPLTGASTFGSALELIFSSEGLASTVDRVEVLRSILQGEIWYRENGRSLQASFFGRVPEAGGTGLQSRVWLPGATVLGISRELSAITSGQRLTINQATEGKNGGT